MSTGQPIFKAEALGKQFSGVTALADVSLELYPGQVTALVGENGAGKSTLMKIISGVYQDYSGTLFWKEKIARFNGPKEAQQHGIAIIHQELNLVPFLSVMENIFLGREVLTDLGMLDKKAMFRQTADLLARLKLVVSPEKRVGELKVGEQQLVEIAKALLTEAELIIMDEPTSAITGKEVDTLFDIVADLKREGKSIVYVSHKLDELFRIADRYVVLRDGKSMDKGFMKDISQDELIGKMVGRRIELIRNRNQEAVEETLLEVTQICMAGVNRQILSDISFSVQKGEILGIFGLMGAGRTELLEAIFGLYGKRVSGHVRLNGASGLPQKPADAMKMGLALVPEDRKADGLVLGMDVKSNICLTTLEELNEWNLRSDKKEKALAGRYREELHIKTSSLEQQAVNLSGGNQQKIVLAKWLATKPTVLLLDEPTRGIDIHAKTEIYKLMQQLSSQGLGIVVVSSELPEILGISDRILVMAEGRITGEFPAANACESDILRAAIPQTISDPVC